MYVTLSIGVFVCFSSCVMQQIFIIQHNLLACQYNSPAFILPYILQWEIHNKFMPITYLLFILMYCCSVLFVSISSSSS